MMKKILSALSVFFYLSATAQVVLPYKVASVTAMKAYFGSANTIIVEDSLRGGMFNYVASGNVDSGTVFIATGKGSGYWKRQYEPSKGLLPEWFGAKADGTTDDRTAIQAAFNAVPTQGGVVVFGAKKYFSSGSISVNKTTTVKGTNGSYSNQSLRPDSTGTVLQTSSLTDTLLIVNGRGCSIYDMAFVNTSTTWPTAGYGVYFTSAASIRVQNCSFDNFFNNLGTYGANFSSISGCVFRNHHNYGLMMKYTAFPDGGDNSLISCFFQADSSVGVVSNLYWRSGGGLKVKNCKFNAAANGYPKYNVEAPTEGITGIFLFEGNSVEKWTESAIKFDPDNTSYSGSIIISGNQFGAYSSSSKAAINLLGGNGTTIGNIAIINVHGNIFSSGVTQTSYAVNMDSVQYVSMFGNTYYNWANKRKLNVLGGAFCDTSSTEVNSSIITENGFAVGVGTKTPSSANLNKLHVGGSALIGNATSLTSGNGMLLGQTLEINSGLVGTAASNFADLVLATNQPVTADAAVGRIMFINTALASERRLGYFGVSTQDATNSSYAFFATMNAGTPSAKVKIMKDGSTVIAGSSVFPAASAMLDVQSTTKGILIPRMTDTQMNAISSPASGLQVINTTYNNRPFWYNGTSWTYSPRVSTGTAAPATTPTLVGDTYIDTTNKKMYVATGNSSSADWTITN